MAFALLPMLPGCQSLVWDPTEQVSSAEGHTNVEERASGAQGPVRAGGGIALGDDAPARPPDSVQAGTGVFVQPVAAPRSASADIAGPDVSLNFDNTDIREIVKIILGDVLEVSYTLDPAVQGTASLTTARPLSRDLLIPTLETLLRMNNAALVDRSGRFEVVPVSNAVQGRVVPQLGGTARSIPEGYSVQVVPLQYVGVEEMANILEPLAPEGSIVRVDTLRNLVVLAGSGPEMTSMLDTIQMFDVDWMAGLSVGFFSLEYAKVTDVVTQLETLLADESANAAKGLFRFIPIESANAMLVVSPQQRYLARIEDWIERLDLAEAAGTSAQRLYVYRVRHGNAESLADILTTLFSDGGGSSRVSRTVGGVAPGREQASMGGDGSSAGSGTTGSASRGATASTLNLSSEVSIVADVVNNSLLVRSSPRDYKKILDALKQLDIVPLQVLVEATIVEIQLTGSLRYGVQWRFKGPAIEGYQSRQSLTQSNSDNPSPTFPGFNWSVVLQPSTIKATLSALAEDNLVNVLSSPTVMVMDNQEAKIEVGDEVPILTTAQQGTSDTDRILNQIEYRQTGVQLSVTPRVTPGGLVQMQIDQQVSSVLEDVGPLGSPSFRNRSITSNVAVRSNQAVVLGGLIQDDTSSGKSGIPGLYRAPIVGSLFGQTNKNARRTELVVVLTPRVIAGDSDIDAVTRDFRRKVKNLDPRF
ncbi:type II secretion system secretin GspD [Lamprobacter modestohalophilus]|uniref:type II secretion system secretin GspD n=1 Tax=Lamprobacter modestohalophilus TaxID=1064514 RepID=UPI002ADED6CD|nr:type II secretion system secretin GspD [Lamprobacter modestohalophilus]MEA1051507.1 type II secretion system secretin GspD [Lamprobacter modestohalophilus]